MSAHFYQIDVRIVDGLAERSCAMGGTAAALLDAGQEKYRRYEGHAWPFAIELRGKLADDAVGVLEVLAQEAAVLADGTGCRRPASLVRKWRRAVELVLALEFLGCFRAAADGRHECAIFLWHVSHHLAEP